MKLPTIMQSMGLSQYEITAYLFLVENHPVNGSQLSRISGVPRSNVYDALRSLKTKGMVAELGDGRYAPLPPGELLKRMRYRFEAELDILKEKLDAAPKKQTYDYVWTISGYEEVMAKAKEMIASAGREIYVELYPEEGSVLDPHLQEAVNRKVEVKYVSMGRPFSVFELQIVHPDVDKIKASQAGRVFDLIVDAKEILVGLFEKGREDGSPISWTQNHWFVMAIREYVRHDFFHCFLEKTLDRKEELTEKERALYYLIKNDAWTARR